MRKTPSTTEEYWVFGYGSLMWRPGFDYQDRVAGRLYGFHRSLCVYSYVHRGTPDCPGLVLGLNNGGSCRGTLFSVSPSKWPDVLAYLRDREQPTKVYVERTLSVRALDGDRAGEAIPALCYVVDHSHEQYAGELAVERMIECVRQGRGQSGENIDYVASTVDHLRDVGLKDEKLEAVVARLRDA
ncbi:MAG: gamma-glutamylcyclotransferase [Pseudomonadota bacterium]